MIEPGNKSQVKWAEGNWIFLDVGFSNSKSSCGVLFGNGVPEAVQFGTARQQIVKWISGSKLTQNLVIEAPLSICFDKKGNPKGRRIEKEGQKTRYWYNGPGCAVMVAAMYLIRDINEMSARTNSSVRLFEGFVSYKSALVASNHQQDVCSLREVVRNASKFHDLIYSANDLKTEPDDCLSSAFCVAGLDCGVPAVIRANQTSSSQT